MAAVSDIPELTVEDIANARPFAEAFPKIAAKFLASKKEATATQ